MTLYLATFSLTTHDYPARESTAVLTRQVEANNPADAQLRLEAYWRARSEPYAVTYTVGQTEISEVIR